MREEEILFFLEREGEAGREGGMEGEERERERERVRKTCILSRAEGVSSDALLSSRELGVPTAEFVSAALPALLLPVFPHLKLNMRP